MPLNVRSRTRNRVYSTFERDTISGFNEDDVIDSLIGSDRLYGDAGKYVAISDIGSNLLNDEIQDINIDDDDLFNDEEQFIYDLSEDMLNAVNGGFSSAAVNGDPGNSIVLDDVMFFGEDMLNAVNRESRRSIVIDDVVI